MAVNVRVLIPAKFAETAQTAQYTAANVTALIDKFTATNVTSSAATISVNVVSRLDNPGNQNLIVPTKTLLPSETYTFPELVGAALAPGGVIWTTAGTSSAINIRASGREIS